MRVNDAIRLMRDRLNDNLEEVYTDPELVSYINMGLQRVGNELAMAFDPLVISTIEATGSNELPLPEDFRAILPGQPVEIRGGNIVRLAGYQGSMPAIKYFRTPPVVNVGQMIPLPENLALYAVNTAVEMALLRASYDDTLEALLHDKIEGIRPTSSGGG